MPYTLMISGMVGDGSGRRHREQWPSVGAGRAGVTDEDIRASKPYLFDSEADAKAHAEFLEGRPLTWQGTTAQGSYEFTYRVHWGEAERIFKVLENQRG